MIGAERLIQLIPLITSGLSGFSKNFLNVGLPIKKKNLFGGVLNWVQRLLMKKLLMGNQKWAISPVNDVP